MLLPPDVDHPGSQSNIDKNCFRAFVRAKNFRAGEAPTSADSFGASLFLKHLPQPDFGFQTLMSPQCAQAAEVDARTTRTGSTLRCTGWTLVPSPCWFWVARRKIAAPISPNCSMD